MQRFGFYYLGRKGDHPSLEGNCTPLVVRTRRLHNPHRVCIGRIVPPPSHIDICGENKMIGSII